MSSDMVLVQKVTKRMAQEKIGAFMGGTPGYPWLVCSPEGITLSPHGEKPVSELPDYVLERLLLASSLKKKTAQCLPNEVQTFLKV